MSGYAAPKKPPPGFQVNEVTQQAAAVLLELLEEDGDDVPDWVRQAAAGNQPDRETVPSSERSDREEPPGSAEGHAEGHAEAHAEATGWAIERQTLTGLRHRPLGEGHVEHTGFGTASGGGQGVVDVEHIGHELAGDVKQALVRLCLREQAAGTWLFDWANGHHRLSEWRDIFPRVKGVLEAGDIKTVELTMDWFAAHSQYEEILRAAVVDVRDFLLRDTPARAMYTPGYYTRGEADPASAPSPEAQRRAREHHISREWAQELARPLEQLCRRDGRVRASFFGWSDGSRPLPGVGDILPKLDRDEDVDDLSTIREAMLWFSTHPEHQEILRSLVQRIDEELSRPGAEIDVRGADVVQMHEPEDALGREWR